MEDGFSLRDATVGILGLGLIGGSLAMSLKGRCARIIGFDSHPTTLELALSRGIVDHAEAFVPAGRVGRSPYRDHSIDLLILAIPVSTIIETLPQLPSLISHPCIVMDVGSTKRDILQAMSTLPEKFDPIGGHPICGKENLGLENADADLFRDAPFVVIPLARTSEKAKSAIKQIISAIGATFIKMTVEEHDRVLATTSHLPFLISSALAGSTPKEFTSLIGPGFRSTTRLAGTPSHMMLGILKSNRDNVLESIQTFRRSLDAIESALRAENYSQLELILDRSRNSFHAITEN